MINQKEVITMRLPFPNVSQGLAVKSHMYICLKEGTDKKFVKCQSFKGKHLFTNSVPFHSVIEESDITRNPFNHKTTIDCDKVFLIKDAVFSRSLLTTSRTDVCDQLFQDIKNELTHSSLSLHNIPKAAVASVNNAIH